MGFINFLKTSKKEAKADIGEITSQDNVQGENDDFHEDVPDDEWIWVDGYKATDKNMCCHSYQYKLNAHEVFEGETNICHSGFHLCLNLKDVFNYYGISDGNRFFKVKALVKNDSRYKNYGDYEVVDYWERALVDKLVAKEIIFTEELSTQEIMQHFEFDHGELPEKYWEYMRENDYAMAINLMHKDNLISYGYSELLANYIVIREKWDFAEAIESQKELTMAEKIICLSNVLR